MKNTYTLGLDIGVTSVGWGIINNVDYSIVDCGVRLFDESDAKNNETRRASRSSRRLKRRRSQRLVDLKELLKRKGIFDDTYTTLKNVYEIRSNGLNGKLTNQELTAALLHICKHRGVSFNVVDVKNEEKDNQNSDAKENDNQLKTGKYICEVQLERLNIDGKVRGLSNNFRTEDYIKEARAILDNQNLDNETIEEIINIIKRKREYYDGPGSETSPTPYGQWFYENGELKHIGMIEKMKGKCSLYKDEYRAPKLSFSAELFNLLNDLNNLSIDGNKLTIEQKEEIMEQVKEKGSITPKQIAKLLEVDINHIDGFRTSNSGKAGKVGDNYLITEFVGYKKLLKIFSQNNLKELCKTDERLLDEIATILTDNKGIEERKEKLIKLDFDLKPTEHFIEELANLPGFTTYHSLSFKAIYEMLPDLKETTLNQMQIIHYKNLREYRVTNVGKFIKFDDTAILSPVAKRAMRETFKTVNALREKFGEFESIIIENTRDKNSSDKANRVKELQKRNKEQKEIAEKEIIKVIGTDKGINGKLREKIRLYMDQDCKTGYTLKPIDLHTLIMDETAYEVDHIIPISISFDDSYNNKILVSRKENQQKGNLTPLMAFNANKFDSNEKEAYIKNVYYLKETKKISYKKADYLLFKEDITKFDVMKTFINRNLVDTSYAARVVYNCLNDYFKNNNIETLVRVVRGQVTGQFRKRLNLPKDRDLDFSHHAIDGLIIASLRKQNQIFKTLSKVTIEEGNIAYDKDTGEIIDESAPEDKYFDSKFIKFLKDLSNCEVNNFSWKINTKPNRQISDATIYSTRTIDGEEKVVKKYKNIYDASNKSNGIKIANDIIEENKDKYLMYHHDKNTFDILADIVNYYYKEFENDKNVIKNGKFIANPFAMYFEKNGPIRKYSKKGNGSPINSLKYLDANLGNHLDITKKYNTKDKKVVLLQISPYRTDFYECNDKNKKYKFITVRYSNIKQKGNHFVIDKEWYENQKVKKGIKTEDKFLFSMNRYEIIKIKQKEKDKNITENTYRFIGTKSDSTNVIEVKPINRNSGATERITPSIGKSIIELKKLSVNQIGEFSEVINQKLKLDLDK